MPVEELLLLLWLLWSRLVLSEIVEKSSGSFSRPAACNSVLLGIRLCGGDDDDNDEEDVAIGDLILTKSAAFRNVASTLPI